MVLYAIIDYGAVVEYRYFDEAPVLPGKPYREFKPAVYETGLPEGTFIEENRVVVRMAPPFSELPLAG